MTNSVALKRKSTMKNVIPLVVSVILGLAAVFVVSKTLFDRKETKDEQTVSIITAARDLDSDEELTEGALTYRDVPKSVLPHGALLWENVSMIYGQRVQHPIARNDYILINDIQLKVSLGDCSKEGEWTIPITFSDPALIKMLKPNDEIGIISTYVTRKSEPLSSSATGNPGDAVMPQALQESERRETSVLLPCVRVLGIANSNGSFREPGSSSGTIFVSLPPQQAMIVIAAQREAELYPVLRKRNDSSALNRKEIGVVNQKTFEEIRKGLQSAELSPTPTENAR